MAGAEPVIDAAAMVAANVTDAVAEAMVRAASEQDAATAAVVAGSGFVSELAASLGFSEPSLRITLSLIMGTPLALLFNLLFSRAPAAAQVRVCGVSRRVLSRRVGNGRMFRNGGGRRRGRRGARRRGKELGRCTVALGGMARGAPSGPPLLTPGSYHSTLTAPPPGCSAAFGTPPARVLCVVWHDAHYVLFWYVCFWGSGRMGALAARVCWWTG